MQTGTRRLILCLICLASPAIARAQLDEIRSATSLTAEQKARIGTWFGQQFARVEQASEAEKSTQVTAFLAAVEKERLNRDNSGAFFQALVEQGAKLATEKFQTPEVDGMAGFALMQSLAETNRPEAIPGFIAGLAAAPQSVRYVAAKTLAASVTTVAADAKLKADVTAAVKKAGVAETNGFILQHMYGAIAYPTMDAEAFATYLAIFDARIKRRREGVQKVDLGEIAAFEYLARPAIVPAITAAQRPELAGRLAFFLRSHAERLGAPNLEEDERHYIAISLIRNEELLTALGINGGGNIANVVPDPALVLAEAFRWVGNTATQTTGALNAAPWNVPVGAP
jgi:hypothetical protein